MSNTRALFENFQSKLTESEQLNEKINKDNIEANRVLSNPNAGKNREKIKDMGYETRVTSDGKVFAITNPKTGRWVDPSDYSKDEKKKVDFKNKLDTEARPRQALYSKDDIPKSMTTGTTGRYVTANADEANQHFTGISQNIKDYKKAVKDKEDAEYSVKHSDDSIKYYEDKVNQAQKDLDFQKGYKERRQKDADAAEAKRKEIIANAKAKRKTESEELTEAGLANLKTIKDYEDVDEFHEALEDDKNTVVSCLDDLKPRLNLEGSVSYIDSIITTATEELDRYNSTVTESEENLTEAYSERYGGNIEDFIDDLAFIRSQLECINQDNFGTQLAREILNSFLETIDTQTDMAKTKLETEPNKE